jgi:thiamine-phosphate pyrophosphorylase
VTALAAAQAPTVILITDPRWPLAHVTEVIERAASGVPGGRLAVQLRDVTAPPGSLAESARRLREVTTRCEALLLVNARTVAAARVALDVGADGVHVPLDLLDSARAVMGTQRWVSTPAHADEEVTVASRAGASAVLVSPIWETPGKGRARGVAAIVAARRVAANSTRVYALGGVDASRAAACAAAGAHGVAVIRALLGACDPRAQARALDAPFHEHDRGGASPPPVAVRDRPV